MLKLDKLGRAPSLRTKHKTILLLLVVLSVTISIVIPVNAQDTEVSVVNPQTEDTNFEFYTNTTFVGGRFNVTLFLYNVSDLFAFQVRLNYNSTLINAIRAWLPTWDSQYVLHGRTTVQLPPDFTPHPEYGPSVLVGDSIIIGDTFDGSGLLAIIEFEILLAPTAGKVSCNLDINNVDTYLLNFGENEIAATKTSGYYEFTWVERVRPFLEVKPNRIEVSKPETFIITVWINNTASTQKLVNITFKLGYDAILLNVTQVIEGSFLDGFGDATFNFTPEAGSLTITTYLESYTSFPDGDGIIATLTFQGIYQDNKEHLSDLKLTDIQFLNDENNPVPFSPPVQSSYKIFPSTSLITINMPKEIAEGSNVTISGDITPNKAGVEVTIYYRALEQEWATLSTVTTDVNSYYEYVWKANKTFQGVEFEYFDFYASWLGDNSTLGAESETVTYVQILLYSSTITIETEPKTPILNGTDVIIKGVIEPTRVNVNVTIHYKQSGEEDWILLGEVQTDSQSRYNFTWETPDLGKYELQASWEGDESTVEDASDIITVEIVETLPIDFMSYLPYILVGIAIVAIALVLYFKKFRKS